MTASPTSTEAQGTEARRAGSGRSAVSVVVLIAASAVLGMNATGNTTLVLAVILLVAALPLVNSRPTLWIQLALITVWTSRLLTVVGSAPRFLDFLDFVLVSIAFLLALVRHLGTDRLLPPLHRKVCRRLAFVALIIVLSWMFNDIHEPQRLIAGMIFALEPFLLLAAIIMAPMAKWEHRRLVTLTAVLLCGQVVFSSAQVAAGGISDEIKGTLLEAGAGHHVSAGGLVLGFLLIAKRQRLPKLMIAAYGGLALFIIVWADAKQVLFVLPVALMVYGATGRRRKSALSLLSGVLAGCVMAAAAVYALLSYGASATAFDFLDRSAENRTGKIAVVATLMSDIAQTPPNLVFGLGPGETVSRFSFLTTPALLKAGSPVTLLGLHASRGAERYDSIAFGGAYTGESSFTSAQSSALGVLGDYGIAGLLGFGVLIWGIIRALRGADDRGLRSAALASWALLLPLAVVFDWLEQPPFTLAVMVITGLALRSESTLADSPPPPAEPLLDEHVIQPAR